MNYKKLGLTASAFAHLDGCTTCAAGVATALMEMSHHRDALRVHARNLKVVGLVCDTPGCPVHPDE